MQGGKGGGLGVGLGSLQIEAFNNLAFFTFPHGKSTTSTKK
jgi:hypothetical protein